MNIPNRILKMADRSGKGFDELFDQEVNEHHTRKEAFWSLENEYREFVQDTGLRDILGNQRYKNYESYRQSRNQRINSLSSN